MSRGPLVTGRAGNVFAEEIGLYDRERMQRAAVAANDRLGWTVLLLLHGRIVAGMVELADVTLASVDCWLTPQYTLALYIRKLLADLGGGCAADWRPNPG